MYYGKPELLKPELLRGRNVNIRDKRNGYRTPLHLCHMSAKYSIYNDATLGYNRGWIYPSIYNQFEHTLLLKSMLHSTN